MAAFLMTFDMVATAKSAAVVIVTLAFIAIVVRVLRTGSSEMDSFAALPLDELPREEN